MLIAKYYGMRWRVCRAKSKIPYLDLDERGHVNHRFSFPFPSFFLPTNLWLKIAFLWIRCAAVLNGLEREDQQDDDEHRAGEESDCAPLAAV